MLNTKDEITRMINRHIARIMCNLEESGCPLVYKNAVKSAMVLIHADLLDVCTPEEAAEKIDVRSDELLTDLTAAACNRIYIQAVESELDWLRSDVCGLIESEL